MKSVSSLHASAEAVNFECTLLNKTASTEETSHRSRWKLCQLITAGPLAERRRWPGVQSESKLKLHVVHSRSNARWILESSSLEALGMKTASRKLPKSLRLYSYTGCFFFFFFFFFFLPFSLFFFFFFFCQKADPQASETKKRGRSYIPVVRLHSKLALATTCTLRVLSQQRHLTVHLTHCDVRWYERDNDLGRSGEITT